MPWQLELTYPDLRWLLEHPDVDLWGMPEVPNVDGQRDVWVLPAGGGGVVDESPADLPAAVEDLLAVDVVARHLPKLLSHPADEHHLFVIIGHGGLPEPQYMAMMTAVASIPPTIPNVPDGLTHLWLTTGYGPSLLCCTPSGWTEHRVFDTAPPNPQLARRDPP